MNWAMERAVIPIAEHYGLEHQLGLLQEECGELIQAISKFRRYGDKDPLIEELADVEVVIAQIKYLLGENARNAIYSMEGVKIARTKAKIAEKRCDGDSCPIFPGEADK